MIIKLWCFKSEPIKSIQHWSMHFHIIIYLSLSNKRVQISISLPLKLIILNNYFFLFLTGFADNYTCWSFLGWLDIFCVILVFQFKTIGTDENTWKRWHESQYYTLLSLEVFNGDHGLYIIEYSLLFSLNKYDEIPYFDCRVLIFPANNHLYNNIWTLFVFASASST